MVDHFLCDLAILRLVLLGQGFVDDAPREDIGIEADIRWRNPVLARSSGLATEENRVVSLSNLRLAAAHN